MQRREECNGLAGGRALQVRGSLTREEASAATGVARNLARADGRTVSPVRFRLRFFIIPRRRTPTAVAAIYFMRRLLDSAAAC